MKYAFIASQVEGFSIHRLCQTLEVSVSGYYAWQRRCPSAHQQADEALGTQIRYAFVAGRGVYGSPRVHAFLRHHGIRCSRKRVARLMRLPGLCAARVRRRKPRTTDSQHPYPIAPNLLERDFIATAPNRKWVADITAIQTQAGWLYLAGIVDTYSRRAIGYAMDPRRDEALVEAAASDGALQPAAPGRARASLGPRQPIHQLGLSGDLGEPGHCAEYERERGTLRQCADGEFL
jgi:putative transposase